MVNFITSKRSCKLLPGVVYNSGKVTNRRLISQLMRQIPLLTIWTLIVIFLLYKSISYSSSIEDNQDEKQLQATIRALDDQQEQVISYGKENGLLSDQPPNSQDLSVEKTIKTGTTVINQYPLRRESITSSDDEFKLLKQENVRQSKVFILIVQNENLRLTNLIHPSSSRKSSRDSSSNLFVESHTNSRKHQRSIIPQHIKILIEILQSHRIDYTIDTTRTGLPTTLLTDNSSETRQYSVIVIDDFIKYTKLSRWVRDQLDRHCRTNQIGVITYLTSNGLEGATIDRKRANPKFDHSIPQRHGQSTTEESLVDRYPLIFKSIDKKLLQNSPSSALVDYQLNEKSQILRILKRRQNFILYGPLAPNIDQSPWVSMFSDHVTFEPLTWAKINDPKAKKTNGNQKSLVSSTYTQEMNHFNPGSEDVSQMGGDTLSQYRGGNNHESNQTTSSELGDEFQNDRKQNSPLMLYNDYKAAKISSHGTSSSAKFNFTVNDEDCLILSMFDRGLYDGIKRVIFGGANHHWLNRMLLLDAVEHLSSGRILSPLTRYIQIDIDDIFVGEKGKRMNSKDVDALVETQRKFAQKIDGGFKFNLGFSGKYFKHGHEDENIGDEQLVAKAKEFTWFCHTWSHSKAHLFNETGPIATELKRNLKFAQEFGLPIVGHVDIVTDSKEAQPPTYAVAPHHSGGK